MKGVILAAGDGGRLRSLTGIPKALLEVGGVSLIEYPLAALAAVGVSDIAVVVGYQADRLCHRLSELHPDLSFVYNEVYDGGNAVSLYAAATSCVATRSSCAWPTIPSALTYPCAWYRTHRRKPAPWASTGGRGTHLRSETRRGS